MSAATRLLAAVIALLAVGAGGALAPGVTVVAPGRLHARTLAVVAPPGCWSGSVAFTPTSPDNGNPPSYHRLTLTAAPGGFSGCIGQYADVAVSRGATQVDLARSYQLSPKDGTSFTVKLDKGALPAPVPAGTTYTVVIHP